MSVDRRLKQFGKLDIVEVYEFYDKPLLFSCKSATEQIYLAVLVDEDIEAEKWFYAPMSKTRFEHVRSGAIDLHDAFAEAENEIIYEVVIPYNLTGEVSFNAVPSNTLSVNDLPTKGERLDLRTQTLSESSSPEVLKSRAEQSRREQIALRLNLQNESRTEAPVGLVGEVLSKFQELLNSIALSLREIAKAKGKGIPPTLNVLQFTNSSFAIEMASADTADLFSESETGRVIEQTIKIIKIGDDATQLKQQLSAMPLRVAASYLNFLKALDKNVSITRIDWASPKEGSADSAQIAQNTAESTIKIIEQIEFEPPIQLVVVGQLIAASIRNKTFELYVIEKDRRKRYAGKTIMAETVSGAPLGKEYRATITQTNGINLATGKIEEKYMLTQLDPL